MSAAWGRGCIQAGKGEHAHTHALRGSLPGLLYMHTCTQTHCPCALADVGIQVARQVAAARRPPLGWTQAPARIAPHPHPFSLPLKNPPLPPVVS